jgi:hypothetical protein
MTTLQDTAVPVFDAMLHNLATLLDKAAAHAAAKGYDVAVLLQSRLSPDMFPLVRFYFHVLTAYAILRHNGVDIGKRDYLGPVPTLV